MKICYARHTVDRPYSLYVPILEYDGEVARIAAIATPVVVICLVSIG